MSASFCAFREGSYHCLNFAVQQIKAGELFVEVCKLHADEKRYEIVVSGEDKIIFRRLANPHQPGTVQTDRRKPQLIQTAETPEGM